jgi:Helicase associated domain
MTIYYAVCSSTGHAGTAGIHLTAESAQQAVQVSKDNNVKCQPFLSIMEARDYIANHVTIPTTEGALIPTAASTHLSSIADADADTDAGTGTHSKKRKLLAPTSKAHNGKNDQKWEEKYLKLKQFTEEIADGNANLATESIYQRPDLSVWIHRQREIYRSWKQGNFENSAKAVDHKGRFIRLMELGVILDSSPSSQWQQMANRWKSYYYPKGMSSTTPSPRKEPLTADNEDPQIRELYYWQVTQQLECESIAKAKAERVQLFPHRYKLLREWNFPFPKCSRRQERLLLHGGGHKGLRKTFEQRLEEYVEYKRENGTSYVPTSEPSGLGEWCKKQRQSEWQDALIRLCFLFAYSS